jgi:hypothetical protein
VAGKESVFSTENLGLSDGLIVQEPTCSSFDIVRRDMWVIREAVRLYQIGLDGSYLDKSYPTPRRGQ